MHRTALLVGASLLLTLASAGHTPQGPRCDAEGSPALGIVEVTHGTQDTTFYVDDRNVLVNSVWIFEETNEIWTSQGPGVHRGGTTDHNLQRGGSVWRGPGYEVPCIDDPHVLPDTLVLWAGGTRPRGPEVMDEDALARHIASEVRERLRAGRRTGSRWIPPSSRRWMARAPTRTCSAS